MSAALNGHWRRRRLFVVVASSLILLVIAGMSAILWQASSQVLYPAGPGDHGSLANCRTETQAYWGNDCGRLASGDVLEVTDTAFTSANGYQLSGWLVHAKATPASEVKGVVLYVPGGGSDRREASRYAELVLGLGYDLAAFDPICHGMSPCPVPGVSFGARERADVASAADILKVRYKTVFVMGSSVGAASILSALPLLQGVAGVIAENPMASFDSLIRNAPEAQGLPDIMVDALIGLSRWRGQFGAGHDAIDGVRASSGVPILFIHSEADAVVSWRQTEELAASYRGPKRVVLTAEGGHGAVWNSNRALFETEVTQFLQQYGT